MSLLSLSEIQDKLCKKEISLVEVVTTCLSTIKENEQLNAFVQVFDEEALQRAKDLDDIRENAQKTGKLHGLVISIKDNICIKDHQVTAASAILKNYVSPFSATSVERLLKEDAIIIGTTNCDEFGMGSANTNSIYGPVSNAIDIQRVSGGSSGGAAVSVKIGACHLALGSDTGGSIRQPAAFNCVVGFKPTYGRISRWGLIAYASSFDQIGFISKDFDTIALALDITEGQDGKDSTCVNFKNEIRQVNTPLKVASFHQAFPIENTYLQEIKQNLDENKALEVSYVDFKYLDYLVPCYYILTTAEASSNLARYDGVRYGHRTTNATNLDQMYRRSRSEGFGKEVKKRIMLGTFVLSEGYFDAYFTKAQKIRRLIINDLEEKLNKYDAIILPTSPRNPWLKEEKITNPTEIYLADIFTVLANLAGMPSVSLPIGENFQSIQMMGKKGSDKELLDWAKSISRQNP